MLAASREKRIARLAMLAGAGTTGAELVLEQQQRALAQMRLPPEEQQKRVELQKKIHEALLSGGSWQGVPDDLRKQADSPWFASLLAFDPAQSMPKVRQPLLIVAAERDRQVPAHHAEKVAALGRARKKGAGVTVVTIPGVNHLFVSAVTGEVAEYASLNDRTISPEVAAAIVKWIGATPRRR
jgi:fermentation-respiration switch protein FrsA (DUF1100 family)